jgi:hypothetical protein
MIQPLPGRGAAFTLAADGDQRQQATREVVSADLGISPEWATLRQVHGNRVVEVAVSGQVAGGADGLFTKVAGLPVAVMAADCAAVLVGGSEGVGAAHAGWRGVEAEVVPALMGEMRAAGIAISWAAVSPFIGSCCFEVGPEVARRFPCQITLSLGGHTSVDLGAVLAEQIGDVPTWWSQRCTFHQQGSFSHRRNGTVKRMAAIGWVGQ